MRISDWSSDVCSSDLGFLGQFDADLLAHLIDREAVHHRIGPAEIDMLENAGAGRWAAKGAVAGNRALVIHLHQLARLDRAGEFGADHVERHGFRGEHGGIAEAAHDERTDTQSTEERRVEKGDGSTGRSRWSPN